MKEAAKKALAAADIASNRKDKKWLTRLTKANVRYHSAAFETTGAAHAHALELIGTITAQRTNTLEGHVTPLSHMMLCDIAVR